MQPALGFTWTHFSIDDRLNKLLFSTGSTYYLITYSDYGVLQLLLTNIWFVTYFIGQLPDYFALIPDRPIIVLRGGEGQITCEAEGYTVSKLQWKKRTASGEESVPDSMVTNTIDKTKNLVRAILNITNAQPQDGGDYKCKLTAYGKQTRKLTSVRVDGKAVLGNL